MNTLHLMRRFAELMAAALLGACGGGSDQAPDSQRTPDSTQLEGAACLDCRAGYLSGVVASGGPWVDAEVRIVDAQGREALGRTDARGRYEVQVTQLGGSLLVQVTGQPGGRAQRLHSACRGAEIGNRAVNVTPLTELLVAQALGDQPERLLRDGRVDFLRLDANGLQQAELAVERLVRPLLDQAGVPAQVDLRVSPFDANLRGLDAALALLQLHPAAPGYRLTLATPGAGSQLLQPGGLAAGTPLPAPSATQAAAASTALAALPAVQARLDEWTREFAAGLPDAGRLKALLAAEFRDGGLDAAAYVDLVLLRQDAADAGGHSLRGARWHDVRLLAVADASTLLLRHRLSLPPPRQPQFEDMWWVQQGGQWWPAGDREVARVAVRNVAVLAPAPLAQTAVRQLPGAWCPDRFELLPSLGIDQRCRMDGGQGSLPAGGLLDLGAPEEAHFGVLGLYRSLAELPAQRLQDYRLHSVMLGAPSQQVERHLAFEVDARRSDARATLVRVTGPGLPASGLSLVRPPQRAGAPVHAHWVWADEGGDLWHGVALGWCGNATDAAQASACTQGWASVQAGSVYRFDLLDSQGRRLGSVESALTDSPLPAERLVAAAPALFARFDLAGQPGLQPVLSRVLQPAPDPGAPDPGQALSLQLPWRAPGDARQSMLDAQVDWWRAGLPPAEGSELVRSHHPAGVGGGVIAVGSPARPGFHSRWLVARLTAQDAMGNHYVHFVAPNNPY